MSVDVRPFIEMPGEGESIVTTRGVEWIDNPYNPSCARVRHTVDTVLGQTKADIGSVEFVLCEIGETGESLRIVVGVEILANTNRRNWLLDGEKLLAIGDMLFVDGKMHPVKFDKKDSSTRQYLENLQEGGKTPEMILEEITVAIKAAISGWEVEQQTAGEEVVGVPNVN